MHVGQHNALIGRDATFKSFVVTFGGDLVRLHPRVAYAGPGGEAELSACTSPTPASTRSTGSWSTTTPRTASPTSPTRARCRATARTRSGSATSSSEAAAEGTDTYEMNRNLVLTDGARVDSVPNLEIETGEIVGAGHASRDRPLRRRAAVLPESRGIPAEEARRLVVRGFFAELVQQIGLPDVEDRLLDKIEAELKASV